jgi:hypothetical protein
MVRRRLGDTGIDPLWDDTFLNDAIDEGLRRYGARLPRQVSTTIAVTMGDRELVLPYTINPLRVVRLFDDDGELWQPWFGVGDTPPSPVGRCGNKLLYRMWAESLYLDAPVPRTGFWRVEHVTNRILPTDDVTPMDFAPGDDDLIIASSLAVALNRRAINDGKRYTGKSGVHPMAAAARNAECDANHLIGSRLRVARSST